MGGIRWIRIGFVVSFFFVLILLSHFQGCWSVNFEGLALLAFRDGVVYDSYGALANWSVNDIDPCMWLGVNCIDGQVKDLYLSGLSLEGTLAPELGKLGHLKALVLYRNCFSGTIPREIEELKELELLDLRDNQLSGSIPSEIGRLVSLKRLLLCDNNFEGTIPSELESLNQLTELLFDDNLIFSGSNGIGCPNRKLGLWIWQRNSKQSKMADSLVTQANAAFKHCLGVLPLSLFEFGKDSLQDEGQISCINLTTGVRESDTDQSVQNLVHSARRRVLEESVNLPAAPADGGLASSRQIISLPTTRSSGVFPAIPKAHKPPPSHPSSNDPSPPSQNTSSTNSFQNQITAKSLSRSSEKVWKYIIISVGSAILLIVFVFILVMCRKQGVTTIGPWKTGLSGQLQKAFITGAPKLNRPELEIACEDFSNIIVTTDDCIVYKGTLSSGVEIAVASTPISSSKDWPEHLEMAFRKKIDTLSRLNHKNFVNLLGYCEEDEPFTRMMVFEYAPNGSLYEHLHNKELEHLDWSARVRIIMGTAYCLQHMHNNINPPVPHSNLSTTTVFLTDDYAAKIAEVCFGPQAYLQYKSGEYESTNPSVLPLLADPETNVHSFGILLLEIISGKLPESDQGSILDLAAQYLDDKKSISYMIDPNLKSFKNNELDVICEVIQECIQPDPRMRPTMMDITSKLRDVLSISTDQAVPRLSSLWWAELEILSTEAT